MLASIVLLGVACRVFTPGLRGIWRDEAQFIFVTRLPTVSALIDFLRFHESHPPLFYLLMRGWTAIAGQSETALRIPALLFAIALVPAVVIVARRIFSSAAAVAAGMLTAVAPVLVYTAVEIRPYSLLSLLAIGSSYALWKGLDGDSWYPWGWYAVLTILMVWTHYWAWVYVVAGAVLTALCLTIPTLRPSSRALSGLVLSWALIGALYLPWLSTMHYQQAHAGHPARFISAGEPIRALLFFCVGVPILASAAVVAALLILAGGAVRTADGAPISSTRRRGVLLFSLTPLAAIAVAQAMSATMHSDLIVGQCIVTLTPFVMILCGGGLAHARVRSPMMGWSATAILLAIMAPTSAVLMATPKSTVSEVARMVAESAKPTDLVLVVPEWDASSFNYYYAEADRQIDFPTVGRVTAVSYADVYRRMADTVALKSVADSLRQVRARGGRVWFITDALLIGSASGSSRLDAGTDAGIARLRVRQFRAQLTSLFGAPVLEFPAPPRGGVRENLMAMLFEQRVPRGSTPE